MPNQNSDQTEESLEIIGESERTKRFAGLYKDTIGNFIKSNHIVIGVGAIGNPIIKMLGQIGVKYVEIYDDDIIEEKNVGTQGFAPCDIGQYKVEIARDIFQKLNPDGEIKANVTKFQKHDDHIEKSFVWLAVDTLDAREFIYQAMMEYSPQKIIDCRMGGVVYQIFNADVNEIIDNPENKYLKSINSARDNLIQESCTTRSVPFTSLLAVSIAFNMALSKNAPFCVDGNILTYDQKVIWG